VGITHRSTDMHATPHHDLHVGMTRQLWGCRQGIGQVGLTCLTVTWCCFCMLSCGLCAMVL
jgi:hypothetical protein